MHHLRSASNRISPHSWDSSDFKGTRTFDLALYNLFKEGRIELEEALRNADSRTNLKAKINFS